MLDVQLLKPLKILAMLGGTALATGCSTPAVLPMAAETRHGTLLVTCSTPYKLIQDCDSVKGALRTLKIGDQGAKVAASSDGSVILVMNPDSMQSAHRDVQAKTLIGTSGRRDESFQSRATNAALVSIRKHLEEKGHTVLRVEAMTSLGRVDGYFIVVSGNGYRSLIDSEGVVPRF